VASPPLIAAVGLLAGLGLGYFAPAWLADSSASRGIAATDAEQELGAALAEFERLDRIAEMASVLARTPREGIDGLLTAVEAAPLNGGDIEYLVFASWWAELDPEAAARWTNRNPRTGGHRLILEELFRVWARRDPESALAAVSRLNFAVHHTPVRAAILGEVDPSELPRLVALLEEIPAGPKRRAAIEAVISRRLALDDDPQGTERWIRDLEDLAGRGRDAALASELRLASVEVWAGIDPAGAAKWSGDWDDPAQLELPASLVEEIAVEWTKRDPQAAMAWLESLPPGAARGAAVREAYAQWLMEDRASALEWGVSQGSAPDRWAEPAVSTYIVILAAEEPLSAIALARNLSDKTLRHHTLRRIVMLWGTRDREAATAWIETSNVPPALEAELRSALRSQSAHRAPQSAGPSS